MKVPTWSERINSQIEKVGLSIIFRVTKFSMYLFGHKFRLRTDHKPLHFRTKLCHTHPGRSSTPTMVISPLWVPLRNWVQVFHKRSHCRRPIQAPTSIQEGLQRGEDFPCGWPQAKQAPSLSCCNPQGNFQESHNGTGSTAHPYWLACQDQHESSAWTIIPPEVWNVSWTRMPHGRSTNHHSSYPTASNSDWITPSSPWSCLHEGNSTQPSVVAWNWQRHRGDSLEVQPVHQNEKSSSSCTIVTLVVADSSVAVNSHGLRHLPIQALPNHGWCTHLVKTFHCAWQVKYTVRVPAHRERGQTGFGVRAEMAAKNSKKS